MLSFSKGYGGARRFCGKQKTLSGKRRRTLGCFGATSFSVGEVELFRAVQSKADPSPLPQNQRGGAEHTFLSTAGSIALVQDPWPAQLDDVAADSGALMGRYL